MNKEQIIKKANKREQLVNKLETSLDSLVKKYQARLFGDVSNVVDNLVTDEEDRLVNNSANTQVIAELDKTLDKADAAAKQAIITDMVNSFAQIVSFNGAYFQEIEPADIKPVSSTVMDSLKKWLGITKQNDIRKNGYLDTLVKSSMVKNAIKERVVGAVVSGQGWKKTKDSLGEFIKGANGKLGALQRYYRNFTYDTYAQVDRKASEEFGNKLGYQFAIYAGGLIETSRKFCREHNGNVYHISEIKKFEPKEAIPPNYEPIADLGGYGCRHSLNWIPDSLAIRLRPDAVKFLDKPEDKPDPGKQEPPVKKEAPKKEPKTAPIPKEEIPAKVTTTQYVNTSARYKGIAPAQAKKVISEMMPLAKTISLGRKITKERIPDILSTLDYLTKKYHIGSETVEAVKFSGGARYYGRVVRMRLGDKIWIKEIDFGGSTDSFKERGRTDVLKDNLKRGKSAVDEENLPLATIVHEWAHVIATDASKKVASSITGKNVDQFFIDLYDIRREYVEEINTLRMLGNDDGAGAIYLGKYANANNNEFMAEAFTEYQLHSTPSKYAIKVGKLIDKYFLK